MPPKMNHEMDYDAKGDDVDAIIFKHLVGSLRCICNSRLDMCYVVGMVSRFYEQAKVATFPS